MMKWVKMGFIYLCSIALAVAIVFFVNFASRYSLRPQKIYKVYLDGKAIGNISDKEELEDYIKTNEKIVF